MADGRQLPVIQPGKNPGQPPVFHRIGVVGLGVIGGSIALAARDIWPSALVIGVDRKDVLERAMVRHAIDVAAEDPIVLAEADLVILAAPIRQNLPLLGHAIGVAGARESWILDWETLLSKSSSDFSSPCLEPKTLTAIKTQKTSEPTTHPTTAKQQASFFKQSGWLMIASIGGGMLTWGVHFLSKSVPKADYSVFGTLLMVTAVLPTMPLQMIFAAQTAAALATNRKRQLSGMIRVAFLAVTSVWLAAAVLVFIFQAQIVSAWKLGSATPLWITLVTVLIALWGPMFTGMLQGCQDFLFIGWSAILGGVGRIGTAAIFFDQHSVIG